MLITQEIFEAFLHCPTKSYLSSRPDVPDAAPNQSWRPWEESFKQNGSSRLRAAVFDCEEYTGTPAADAIKRQQYRMIFDYTALTTDLRARIHALELVHFPGAKDRSVRQYVPIRLLSEERISTADRLLLAFDALVFSQAASTTLPPIGKLMHGREYSMATVLLTPLYPKVQSVIAAIYTQQASSTPPPLLLNKHCGECQYASRCRRIATEADDLSLIVKINAKERKKYHEKGIFTVTQLSYTFRPRRRIVNHRKHEYALQAHAIRKKQVHVIGTPTLTTEGTPVYFDVEGDPDRNFYYCIGLRFEAGGVTIQRSHWADGPSDEGTMWTECLRALDGIDYVRRFEKNRDRLFTFLDHDGIPWNNNNAEHAIKAFARLRNVIGGSSTKKGLREYLVLLSISQTCKCKGVSFLDFLLSEEADVETGVGPNFETTS